VAEVPEGNGDYDWQERMRRMEDAIERNWQDHERIDRNIDALRASMVQQKENVDKLLSALRQLIDRIPPENLR
jgi:predicted  nucleic acid-binding Zn-ribbon protein